MQQMPHDMMHGMPFHMFFMWAGLAFVVLAAVALVYVLRRPASAADIPLSEWSNARQLMLPDAVDQVGSTDNAAAAAVDTIFVLPDISNYTRFMTGTQFSLAHAQHIIFSLINAMIRAATVKLELSKLEGDAALFFVDTNKHTDIEIGESVMEIFAAFFRERERLKASNICPCHACRHIDTLDLKIFVHRGKAARFRFRGAVDLFGTDVIVLHRIMKNDVSGNRYVMLTDAATSSVTLPNVPASAVVEHHIPHIGPLRATVMEIDDQTATLLARITDSPISERVSVFHETLKKLQGNLRLLRLW